MTREFTDEQRALRADALLTDPILTEAFNALTGAYVLAFRKCDPKDDRGRLRYQDALNDIDVVKAHLMAVVARGKLSDAAVQAFQKTNMVQKITRIF